MPEFAVPVPSPALNIPPSESTVTISCIDTTSTVFLSPSFVVEPAIEGHDELVCPNYAFLIEHKDNKILFDLGARKDLDAYAPLVKDMLQHFRITAETDIKGVIGDINVDAVIWSHHHWDHVGDMSHFPPQTDLVVGPGFKKEYMPGYPTNPDGLILESDYEGRSVHEIDFEEGGNKLKLGNYKALDYFSDGSFYLLDCPGHTVGHLNALARTTPTTFVLLGADCCHHGGEFRPTEYLPLPSSISPNPLGTSSQHSRNMPCPGSLFLNIHPRKSTTQPFYSLKNPGISHDFHAAHESMLKLTEFDANDDVLVMLAHDNEVGGVVDLWPKTLNDWKSRGWKEKIQWAFLKDFKVDTSSIAQQP